MNATTADDTKNGSSTEGRGIYDGFEGYVSATSEDYRRLLTAGVIIPDANVLLDLYRYGGQARADLLAVFERLGDRLWIPHQAVVEFWRNREAAIRDPEAAAERASEALEEHRRETVIAIRTWANRIALDASRITELTGEIEQAISTVLDAISEVVDAQSHERAIDTQHDPVLGALSTVLSGRIGGPFGEAEHATAVQEGLRRIDAEIPPGYLDAKNKKSSTLAVGDYLVWEQILAEAARRRVDVLVVTGDVKEDWWRRVDGNTRGPRVELVDELKRRAGVRLYMLRPESLLVQARHILQVDIRDETLQDVERVESLDESEEPTDEWPVEMIDELLSRLDQEAPVQAAAVRAAAAGPGNRRSRCCV